MVFVVDSSSHQDDVFLGGLMHAYGAPGSSWWWGFFLGFSGFTAPLLHAATLSHRWKVQKPLRVGPNLPITKANGTLTEL